MQAKLWRKDREIANGCGGREIAVPERGGTVTGPEGERADHATDAGQVRERADHATDTGREGERADHATDTVGWEREQF